ncbi:MAG: sigma-70 family RNA polymerase sigma factor [Planctomycetes bacterium]|nr:sigma-70 family RNA polymerase sigma factor [Planctomycetota bacterium]
MQPQSPPLEQLLAEVHWIRALSRHLVRDPDLADEIVQQTLIRASAEGPREATRLRAWLAEVLRNFARAGLRSQSRRRHHEQRAARREGLPSTHEIVERAALQRELVQSVMELEEPYRTTLLLRFYESRRPNEIARTLGVPPATVRTRLARGLSLLRARLDRQHGGDRAAWACLAWPLPSVSLAPLGPLSSILAMNLKATLSAVALCAVGVVWFLVTDSQPTQPLAQELSDAGNPKPAQVERPAEAEVQAAEAVARAPREVLPVPAAPVENPTASLILGRVLDMESRAVARVPIRLLAEGAEGGSVVATSDEAGGFSIPRPARPTQPARLEIADERWATVFAGLLGREADQQTCTIIVAPSAALAGMVVDDAGMALSEVEVSVQPLFSLRTRFAENLDSSEDVTAKSKTDQAGRFEFPGLPRCAGLRLAAELGGHVPFSAPLVETDRPFKTITLTRTSSADGVLRGRVVDEGDLPVPKAVVALGLETTVSDERGEFAIAKQGSPYRSLKGDPLELRALAPGRLPASYVPPRVGDEAQWPEFVTLRLGGKPLSISGRVVRADGTPLPGARVWLDDTTTFGDGPGGTLQLEGWLAGDTENAWHFATSGEDGGFELGGLLDREYTLCAVDAATLERATLAHVAAGRTDLVVRFDAAQSWPGLEGTVVDDAGVPLADVRVVPRTMGFMARHAGRNLFSTSMSLDGTVTDSDGRFVLERLPREGVSLDFSGNNVVDRGVTPDPAMFSEPSGEQGSAEGRRPHLRIVLERRMQVQVELVDPEFADQFALLDAEGRELTMTLRTGTTTYFMARPPILEGHSHVASVGQGARTVVFYRGDQEVGRTPVRLLPGEITLVRR